VRRTKNVPFLCVFLSWNLEASTSRNSSGHVKGLHKGLLYLLFLLVFLKKDLDATCNRGFSSSSWDSPTSAWTCDKQLYLLVSTQCS
jgi:hypothetical protein